MTIGIYGGTFSPIHYGHIGAAHEFLRQCDLHRLYIVPAAIPPHKRIDESDNPDIRYEMVKLAFKDDADITVSDFEIKSKGPSYTVNTLKHFKEQYNADIKFLCGADMFVTLDKWYKAAEIFTLTGIVYVDRGNINIAEKAELFRQNYNADITGIQMSAVDISSTRLREMIAAGEDVSAFIPPDIVKFIERHGLYSL